MTPEGSLNMAGNALCASQQDGFVAPIVAISRATMTGTGAQNVAHRQVVKIGVNANAPTKRITNGLSRGSAICLPSPLLAAGSSSFLPVAVALLR